MTTETQRAIEIIEEARQSHVDWRDHLRSGCDGSCWTPQGLVETPEKQQEWIDKYDHVLSVLRAEVGVLSSSIGCPPEAGA